MNSKDIINWILSETLHMHCAEELVLALAPRLTQAVKVNFISLDVYTVRSKVAVRNLSWHKGKELQTTMLSPSAAEERFVSSKAMCAEQRNCIVLPMYFTRGRHTHVAYASESELGFNAQELEILQHVTPALARRLEIESYHHFYGFGGVVEDFWERVAARCRAVSEAKEGRQ